ncbi:hypothetical protein ABKV19_002722 [Rosa sericea]
MALISRKTAASLPSSAEPVFLTTARRWKYDVFVSFMGVDTGWGFTSHLHNWLQTRGITTFMDEPDLVVGGAISRALLKAIKESRFAIVVLSQNYASSTWCLEELTKICQFMEDGPRILPVFYHVDPTAVRNQKKSFQDAFTKHERSGQYGSEKVKQWRDALRKVGRLSGWHTHSYKTERDLVDAIVESVCSKLQPVVEINTGDFELFEATRQAMDEVMNALKDDEVTAVGVYGMGGVGKTTLVEHVAAEAQKNGIFHHVVMVIVSQSPDLRKIQGRLAELLGVELREETEIGRTATLSREILRRNKILIILDDIWERLEFSSLGIPSYEFLQNCNSKILLTTRIWNVCHAMKCQEKITLNVLSEEDSWTLFVGNARRSFETFEKLTYFNDIARKVVRKCCGLPIALIAVARALEFKDLMEWEKAGLRKSQTANPDDMGDASECIKLSYDYLKDEDYKSCFLLCCLFPEDYDIRIEHLFRYAIGKGLFQDADSIQEARETVYSLVKYLKGSSLLLDCEKSGCVRVHDVIRDTAIQIAQSENGFLVKAGCRLKDWPRQLHEGYSAVSLMENDIRKLPKELVCPNLQILLLQQNADLNKIPATFFQSLNELRVLDLSYTSISLLPQSFSFLTNLQALYLDCCMDIVDISMLGQLRKLETLSMREYPLEELSKEIGHLTNLRMLDITDGLISKIPSNVIVKFHRLEELYMDCGFWDWGSKVEGKGEETNVGFDEVIDLPKLKLLKVCISDAKCIPTNVEFQPHWVYFDICISRDPSIRKLSLVSGSSPAYSRVLTLDTTINTLPEWFIDVVTKQTEKLQYIGCRGLGNILLEYDHGRLHQLKYLSVIGANENLEELMNTITPDRNKPVFQNLEELHLVQVDYLKELCGGQLPPGSLCNLRLLKVKHCYQLVGALLPSRLLQRLQNLEKLVCEEMDELEYVFGCEGLKPEQIILTKLIEMRLENLGKLRKIWNGLAPCAIFQNLQSLVVSGCFGLTNLFTADVAQWLLHLEDLSVEFCLRLDSVIEASKETVDNNIVFPKLKKLALIQLPQLTRFCSYAGTAIECPPLEYLYVERCPRFSTSHIVQRRVSGG